MPERKSSKISKKESKKRTWLVIILLLTVFSIPIFVGIHSSGNDRRSSESPSKSTRLDSALKYLHEIEEIRWIDIDGNSVYIGFDPLSDDYIFVGRQNLSEFLFLNARQFKCPCILAGHFRSG